jgi:hypothetical protein
VTRRRNSRIHLDLLSPWTMFLECRT